MEAQQPNTEALEQCQRDFLNSIFGLLKGLSIHDLQNESIQRPRETFEKALEMLRQNSPAQKNIEIKYSESLLTIVGVKLANHFSIVEASKQVPEFMDTALIEKISLAPGLEWEDLGEFFSKWALHCSVHQKPKQLMGEYKGIKIDFLDPEKSNLRLKSKQLLLSPAYALNHYWILKKCTLEFFKGITSNQILSQKLIRRELLEMIEIAKVNPYQLVALSLLRSLGDSQDPLEENACEAISTALLSMVIARELDFSVRDQVNIGMVGLMYNVGLLSEELAALVKSDKKLSQLEYKKVLDAQASGVFKLIKSQGSTRPALERLLSLFEATQGNFKKSISLTLDSRLLRLTSQYIALTSSRPYRNAYTPTEAMKLLGSRATSKREGNLDPVLYYVFVRYLGVYPIGSLVLLSNNEKAIVYRPSGEKTGVPMLKILPQNPEDSSVVVDLASEANLSIIKQLDPTKEGIHIPAYFFE